MKEPTDQCKQAIPPHSPDEVKAELDALQRLIAAAKPVGQELELCGHTWECTELELGAAALNFAEVAGYQPPERRASECARPR